MILNWCFLLSICTITAIGIVFWYRYLKSDPNQKNAYLNHHEKSPVGMLDFLVAYLIWMGLPMVAVLAMPFDISKVEELTADQQNILIVILAVSQLIGCGLILVYLAGIRYGSLGWLINFRLDFVQQIKLTAKAFCMIVPPVLGIQALLSNLIPYEHDTLAQLAENFSIFTVLATWMGAVIAAPICEELLFRGVLQSWLQRIVLSKSKSEQDRITELAGGWSDKLNDASKLAEQVSLQQQKLRWWFPILASSALFSFIHIGQGAAPIPLFLFALGLGFLFRYSGSLIPCIILHFMLNAFTMFWMTLQLIFGPLQETG